MREQAAQELEPEARVHEPRALEPEELEPEPEELELELEELELEQAREALPREEAREAAWARLEQGRAEPYGPTLAAAQQPSVAEERSVRGWRQALGLAVGCAVPPRDR